MRTLLICMFWVSVFQTIGNAQKIDDTIGISQKIIIKKPLFLINNEGARWTVLPKFSPLVVINWKKKLQDSEKKDITNSIVPENNFTAGIRFYRYAPINFFTFGGEVNYLHRGLSIQKENVKRFSVGSLEFTPFISFKPGRVLRIAQKNNYNLFHITLDGGFSYSTAMSRRFYSFTGKYNHYKKLQLLDNDQWRLYTGIGLLYNALSSKYRRLEQFQLTLQYYHPLEANYFKGAGSIDDEPEKFVDYLYVDRYFTFSIGYIYSLSKPRFTGKANQYEHFFPKRYRYFRMPWYYEEPEKRTYGGFFWSLINTPKVDSFQHVFNRHNPLPVSMFRMRNNLSAGYHFHFLSNFQKYYQPRFRYSLFSGISYNRRQIIIEDLQTHYEQLNTFAIEIGGRIGFSPGIYLIAGGSYNVLAKYEIVDKTGGNLSYLNKYTPAYYLGLGFRNLFSIQLQNNPLLPFNLKSYYLINRFEYKITVGF